MIPESTIQGILDRVDIVDVVRDYVPDLKERGGKAECCCPFHSERTPSFKVDSNKGLYYCYGCGKGGNVFQFVQEMEHCDFPSAVKKVGSRFGIKIDEDKAETAEQREKRIKVETMRIINGHVCNFYADQLWKPNESSKRARDYIFGRKFKEEFVRSSKFGYAPKGNVLLEFAKAEGLSIELMIEMGLLGRNDQGEVYDAYRDRWIIPIFNRANAVVGFTCRQLPGNDRGGKYVNSRSSDCYDKSSLIFGLNQAVNKAVKEGVFYLVEGAPDVLRLQSIGATNAIATLGTAWTREHFERLKRYKARLCFIPDCDEVKDGERYGTGVKKVMENGRLAMQMGLDVSVKEIQPGEDGKKQDPDSFITSQAVLKSIETRDFVLWYFGKVFVRNAEPSEQGRIIEDVASLIALVQSNLIADSLINTLSRDMGQRKQWKEAVSAAKKENKEESQKRSKNIDRSLLEQYGFCQDENNSYYSIGDGGKEYKWSNFIMVPLFHIEDSILPKRLYKIKNQSGVEKIIELKQSDLTSLARFSERVEGLGNFIWLAKQDQLNKLKMFLYEQTETATEIIQLGWQPKGFWAFGNGAICDGQWIPTDDYGIVRLGSLGNFYLPANSVIYRGETKLFQFERRFVHSDYSHVSLRQYTNKMVEVFGNNAKVGICFLLATLFKDVVTGITKNFPLLNLFGQKGSGKSEMGHTLMSFFIAENVPPNLQNSTDAALADAVAQCANALVHLDEYKNTIDITRREFLKGLYDGTGRTRMNMDRDKKREITAVDCGVIISGQEMPTIDNALFSRLLYLTFNQTEFSTEAKKRFDELKDMRKMGCTHLTVEIIGHRKKFEVEFPGNYRSALSDVVSALEHDSIDDRILRSWVIPLAAFRTLSGVLDLGFDYKEMLQICIDCIVRQNSETRSNNELAQFWTAVDVMHTQGLVFSGQDFRIVYERGLKCDLNGNGIKLEFQMPRPILYLNYEIILSSYQKFAKQQGDTVVPTNTLKNYLEVSREFYGKKRACRFLLMNNPQESSITVEEEPGRKKMLRTSKAYQAYCFDYLQVSDKFGINLEISTETDLIDEKDVEATDKSLPF